MPEPFDYTLNVQQPFQAALQGYQAGAAIRNDQQQQQHQQAALVAQQRRQEILGRLASNPNATADDYAAVITQLPDLAEPLTKAWSTRNTAQQQAHASDLLQWGAAIKSGRPDVAAQQLNQRADAMEAANGGQPTNESKALRVNAQVLQENPQLALGKIQAMLAANPLGKDAAETLAKFGTERRADEMQPSAVRKAGADADKAVSDAETAAVDAKFAEQKAVAELKEQGIRTQAILDDTAIKREANRIAAMNAAAAREGNALKREELGIKVQEARNALDDKIRAKRADVESAAGTIDNLINTVDRLKKNPSLDDVVGSIEGRLPAVFGDENADAVALIETLGSQTFLAQIPAMKGLGALSEKEGDKLQSSVQNLSRAQSEGQFRANLDEVQRLMLKARKSLETRYGIKTGVPDTPAVQTPAADIDALVNKYLNPRPPGAR